MGTFRADCSLAQLFASELCISHSRAHFFFKKKKNPVRLLMQWKVQRSLPGLALFTVESTKKTGVYRMVCHEKLYVLIWTHITDCFLRRALVALLELKPNLITNSEEKGKTLYLRSCVYLLYVNAAN